MVFIIAEYDKKYSVVLSILGHLTSLLNAGEIIKAATVAIGGSGGGRADYAQAGGIESDKLDEFVLNIKSALGELQKG